MEVDTEVNEINEDSGLLPVNLGVKMDEGNKQHSAEEPLRLPKKARMAQYPIFSTFQTEIDLWSLVAFQAYFGPTKTTNAA